MFFFRKFSQVIQSNRIASLSFSDSRTKQAVKLSHRSRVEDDTALFCRFEHRLVKAVYVRADVFSEER